MYYSPKRDVSLEKFNLVDTQTVDIPLRFSSLFISCPIKAIPYAEGVAFKISAGRSQVWRGNWGGGGDGVARCEPGPHLWRSC